MTMNNLEKKVDQRMIDAIAIDGPAASGKTTLAQLLARHLGYLFFDTGVMYRAITLATMRRDVSVEDEQACTRLAEQIKIDVRPPSEADGRMNDIFIDGEDQTWEIRLPEVEANVSIVSAYPGVRRALTKKQREIGGRGKVIMVGRDIGTVVLPDARLKIYLDASVEERARRRYNERLARGEKVNYQDVLDVMRARDEIDSNRDIAPLRPAEDAVIMNSDGKSVEEIFQMALDLIEEQV